MGRALAQYQRQFRENPQSLAGLVGLQPAWEGKQLSGYRLVPGTRKGFLKRFGLRGGDVVKAVNGQALDSPAKGLDALKALTSASEISLEVVRADKRLLLTFKVGQ